MSTVAMDGLNPFDGAGDDRAQPMLPIPVTDTATRMFLFSQLVAQLDACDERYLQRFISAGLTPELMDRLRGLSLGDTVRFASGQCGLSIHVDCDALKAQLARIERARDDRSLYEHFVRAGASPRLIARLFAVSHTDVRRLRRVLAPEVCIGGRPRMPDDESRAAIRACWADLADVASEKLRYWQLSQRFPELLIVSLECIVDSDEDAGAEVRVPALGAWSRRSPAMQQTAARAA